MKDSMFMVLPITINLSQKLQDALSLQAPRFLDLCFFHEY